jgi:multidrug efflux system membrane fusion protein
VSVARAEQRSVPFQVAATGTVESMRSAAVISQVGGLLLHVRFREGDEVAQGQVLFEIDSRPFAASVQQAEANLSRDIAQADAAVRATRRSPRTNSSPTKTTRRSRPLPMR